MSENLDYIGAYAFFASKITTLNITQTVSIISTGAFKDCTSLTDLAFEDKSKLTTIGSEAFRNCTSLKAIIIPDSVTEIGDYAFTDCISAKTLKISNSIVHINNSSFAALKAVDFITIPEGVTHLYRNAFVNGLAEEILLPSTLKSISIGALQMSNLKYIYYNGTIDDWNKITVDYSYNGNVNANTRYFYSEEAPTTEGNFWHYVDGIPTPWENVEE